MNNECNAQIQSKSSRSCTKTKLITLHYCFMLFCVTCAYVMWMDEVHRSAWWKHDMAYGSRCMEPYEVAIFNCRKPVTDESRVSDKESSWCGALFTLSVKRGQKMKNFVSSLLGKHFESSLKKSRQMQLSSSNYSPVFTGSQEFYVKSRSSLLRSDEIKFLSWSENENSKVCRENVIEIL